MTTELKSANSVKIGKTFTEAREEIALSKVEVAKASVMNIKYIEAIESGDYSIFPSESFARAYFIKYQEFLSLNSDFPSIYYEDNRKSEIIEKSITKFNSSFIPPLKKSILVLFVFFTLVVALKIFLIDQIFNEGDISRDEIKNIQNQPKETEIINNQIDSEKPIESIEIHADNDEIRSKNISLTEKKLILTFTDECWIEVYLDNKLIINKLFQSGNTYTLKIEKPFKVVVGNADSVEGTYNGNTIDFITNANRLRVNTIIFNDE